MQEHSHKHNHSHNHEHSIDLNTFSYNKAFGWGIGLNVVYVVIEFIYGLLTNSMALISDAGHNLSDVLGLILSLGAYYIAKSSSNLKRTYGLKKTTIFAAHLNAVILIIALGIIVVESSIRLFNPKVIYSDVMITVASIGIIINFGTALLFIKGKSGDLNVKSSFIHMLADAGISLGVVIAAILIKFTGYYIIDPIISILIALFIAVSTVGLLKDSFNMLMDSVPSDVDLEGIRKYLLENSFIADVHDLHVWAISTTENALTVHVVLKEMNYDNSLINKLSKEIANKFGINHSTFQLELPEPEFNCKLKENC